MYPITPRAPRRCGRAVFALLLMLSVTGPMGFVLYRAVVAAGSSAAPENLIVHQASRAAFDHVVLEQGELESRSNVEVVCEIEASYPGTQILWVADEGTRVRAGDRLVVLDSSALEDRLLERRLRVLRAEALVKSADADHRKAEISKQEYMEGIYARQRDTIQSQRALAEESRRKAELGLRNTERLVEKGVLTPLQLEGDQFAVLNAATRVEQEKQKLHVLETLTRERLLVKYDGSIESTAARLTTMQRVLLVEQTALQEIEAQIAKCIIHSPADGVVVHANRYSSRGGNAEFVVEAGSYVRERQTIIRLPDPAKMQVNCKVSESKVTLLAVGMPVKISIDAMPGMNLKGRVSKVNRYADPDGYAGTAKEYGVLVELLDAPENIRTGMTADVKMFVEQIPDSLQIPVQGLYEHGGELYTLIQKGPTSFETRKLGVRTTNDVMASVSEGLEPGEMVVLNLRQHLDLMELPEQLPEDNSDMQDLREDRYDAVADNPAPEVISGDTLVVF